MQTVGVMGAVLWILKLPMVVMTSSVHHRVDVLQKASSDKTTIDAIPSDNENGSTESSKQLLSS